MNEKYHITSLRWTQISFSVENEVSGFATESMRLTLGDLDQLHGTKQS